MRRYLKEFLSDRRVIETNRLLWWPLLNLVILTTRPGRKGRDYASIWNNERNEGPLKTITRAQAEDLPRHLEDKAGDRISVDWAMRYGKPDVKERIGALLAEGCDRILRAALSAIFRRHLGHRLRPCLPGAHGDAGSRAVRVSPPYYDDPVYIDAVVSVDEAGPGEARLRAGGHPRLLPRRAEGIPPEGRSLPLPLREDLAPRAKPSAGRPTGSG